MQRVFEVEFDETVEDLKPSDFTVIGEGSVVGVVETLPGVFEVTVACTNAPVGVEFNPS